jgi:hypothetical protein
MLKKIPIVYFAILVFAVILYIAHLYFAIMFNRGFYLDGAYFFVSGINSAQNFWPHFDDSQHNRLFVNLLNQLPFSAALKMGVTNLDLLRLFYTFPLFTNSALIMLATLYVCRQKGGKIEIFIFSLASFVLFSMPSEIFIVNPAFTTTSLSWLLLAFILSEKEPQLWDFFAVSFLCLLHFKSHEGVMFFGLCLVIAALLSIKSSCIGRKKLLRLVVIGMVGAIAYNVYWQFQLPSQAATDYFNLVKRLINPINIFGSNLFFSVMGGIGLFLVAIQHWRPFYNKSEDYNFYVQHLLAWCFGLVSLLYSLFFIVDKSGFNPFLEYEYRVLLTFGPLILMPIAIGLSISRISLKVRDIRAIFVVLGLTFSATMIWQIRNDAIWADFVKHIHYAEAASTSPIVDPVASSDSMQPIATYTYGSGLAWTLPSLGVALSSTPFISKIFKPLNHLEHFYLDSANSSIGIPFTLLQDGIYKYELFHQAIESQFSSPLKIPKRWSFQKKIPDDIELIGFDKPENWGTWSKEHYATLRVKMKSNNLNLLIKIAGRPYLTKQHPIQRVEVSVNGNMLAKTPYRLDSQKSSLDIVVPYKFLRPDGIVEVKFYFPDAISPGVYGDSKDSRVLAFGLTNLFIETMQE